MPFSTLLGEDGLPPSANTKNEEEEEEEEDRAYDYACDELLKSGALSPINDSFLDASQELERGRSRDELADFIAEELQKGIIITRGRGRLMPMIAMTTMMMVMMRIQVVLFHRRRRGPIKAIARMG